MNAIRFRFSAERARIAAFFSCTVGLWCCCLFGRLATTRAFLCCRRSLVLLRFLGSHRGRVPLLSGIVVALSCLIATLDAAANKMDILSGDAPGNEVLSPWVYTT